MTTREELYTDTLECAHTTPTHTQKHRPAKGFCRGGDGERGRGGSRVAEIEKRRRNNIDTLYIVDEDDSDQQDGNQKIERGAQDVA